MDCMGLYNINFGFFEFIFNKFHYLAVILVYISHAGITFSDFTMD